MTDQDKIHAIFADPSCVVVVGAVVGEPRVQETINTSDIGVCREVVTWPNPLGHAKQGYTVCSQILDSYTGPE